MKDGPPCNEIEHQARQQGTKTPFPNDLPAAIAANSKRNNKKGNPVDDLENRAQSAEKWMVFLTGLIVAVTIAGVAVAYRQWSTMDRQLKEMQDSGKQTDLLIRQVTEQAKAANQLAEIARNSLIENRAQFHRDQRPYIIPTVEPAPVHPVGAPITAKFFLVNYGKSPAIKVSGYAAILFGRDALKQADEWFAAKVNQRFNSKIGTVIPPGIPNGLNREKYTLLSGEKILGGKDVELINKVDYSVVIVMRHLYFDGAGNSYRTDSCFTMLKTWEAAYCQDHNEIYDEADQQRYEGITTDPHAN
jgi:hypothetical protein